MAILQQIEKDIISAMKARETLRLETLRMVKSILKSREIEKREPLTDAEEIQAMQTMLKQRKDAAEQFTQGDRPELAAKELEEFAMIQAYLPQTASDEEVRKVVQGAIAHLAVGGTKPGPKDMGPAMRIVQQRILADGLHADNKTVSTILKEELAKSGE